MDIFDLVEEKKENGTTVYFDLESQRSADEVGWGNIDLMFMSIGVVYIEPQNEFVIFTEDKVQNLIDILFNADRVVGFNLFHFDYKVLSHYTNRNFNEINTTDMFIDIKEALKRDRGPSLDNIASSTFEGVHKSAKGIMALQWWKEGKIDEIIKYCKNDVQITKDVYKYGLKNGKLYALNTKQNKVEFKINWKIRKGESHNG